MAAFFVDQCCEGSSLIRADPLIWENHFPHLWSSPMKKTDSRRPLMLFSLLLASIGLLAIMTTVAAEQPRSLAGTEWQMVEFQSMDDAIGTIRPDDPTRYTMRLGADGSVSMQLNCNRATGDWSAEPSAEGTTGSFRFGSLAMTRALCPPPSMDERIARDADHVRGYLLEGGNLYLSLMADAGIYAWEPLHRTPAGSDDYALPDDGGPRNWEVSGVSRGLNLREEASLQAKILKGLPAGTVLDNLGCKQSGGRIWCDVQEFGGGMRGYVAAEYLKPAVSPDGSVARGPDLSAERAGKGKFDATGTLSCAEGAGQPLRECDFGVARAGGGYSTVVVQKPYGGSRAIYFRMGKAIGADTSEADGYQDFSVTRENGLNRIQVGPERYEIPDAVVFGG
jgi:heat shock protein HslJ